MKVFIEANKLYLTDKINYTENDIGDLLRLVHPKFIDAYKPLLSKKLFTAIKTYKKGNIFPDTPLDPEDFFKS